MNLLSTLLAPFRRKPKPKRRPRRDKGQPKHEKTKAVLDLWSTNHDIPTIAAALNIPQPHVAKILKRYNQLRPLPPVLT
jgi:hypothetical protein